MICLQLKFPAGRYHATPWGRHVNEGDVAWPPEPYRILRALIATWHRKADHEAFPYDRLSALIEVLSEVDPQYFLPESVHAHTRHYMPQGSIDAKTKRESTKLVIDAFLRIDADDPLVIGWDVETDKDALALLEHLAARLSYFGRAESIVIAEALTGWPPDRKPNALPRPVDDDGVIADGPNELQAIDVLAPVKASVWQTHRERLFVLNGDKPKTKGRRTFEATMPERLVDALAVDTGEIQAAKWSAPPAGRLVLYDRAPLSPTPRRTMQKRRAAQTGNLPSVARFVLAGKPRPSVFDTVKIAETMRIAVMSQWGWENGPAGKKLPKAPFYISGRDAENKPLRDPAHSHAFWLPEDADGDGLIDHVIVYAKHGFEGEAQHKLDRLARLWIEHAVPDGEHERGRKEWRLALEGFGMPSEFSDSAILPRRQITMWRSASPYLRPRFGPRTFEETETQIRYELGARGFPAPVTVSPFGDFQRPHITIRRDDQKGEPIIKFRRTRTRRGLVQPDVYGCAVIIEFPSESEIDGPLALGFGAHFGLGLFKAADLS
jgi:CRISPR-associated protein Csb2